MIHHYLLVAIRNLKRHKLHSAINILGLAVGMACCLLIILFIIDELSYDHFHGKADRIYRIVSEFENETTGEIYQMATTPYQLTELLKEQFPEIEKTVRFYRINPSVRYGNKQFFERQFCFADATVFDVFSFPLEKGDPKTALKEPYSIVINTEIARKYFGDTNPMGKLLWVGDSMPTVKVTGILKDTSDNSHIGFNALLSMSVSQDLFSNTTLNTWRNTQYTYVLLRKGISSGALEEKLVAFVKQLYKADVPFSKLILQPITRIHLHSNIQEEWKANGSIDFVYTIGSIAVLVMAIACLNFMSLSTARSIIRAKEISLRKVVGAHRWQLVAQFLGESVLLSCIALCITLSLVKFSVPWFNKLMATNLQVSLWQGWVGFPSFVGFAFFIGLVAGCYPAFVLSDFQPVQALQEQKVGRGVVFRNALVVVQFCISIVMLICTGIVFEQLEFLRSKALGFEKENVVVIERSRFVHAQLDAFKAEVLKNPNVLRIGTGRNVPPDDLVRRYDVVPEGGAPREMAVLMVDSDYFRALGIDLEMGRDFSQARATDAEGAVILNRAAIEEFGWGAPLGKTVRIPYVERQGQVIGVIEDFHFESLYQEIVPMAFIMTPRWYSKFVVRVRFQNIMNTIEYLKQTWDVFVPDRSFEFYFLSSRLDGLYQAEKIRGHVSGILTGLAMFVACLGLFGLAAFTAERRTKEIGIRKVLGASAGSIVMLLSKDFLTLVMVANLIAWPVAYWAMRDWLTNFAYRIDLHWIIFVLSGGLALLVAFLTVSYQAWKAACTNPVDALRKE